MGYFFLLYPYISQVHVRSDDVLHVKLKALEQSLLHTLKRFWDAKRILMLAIFALAAGNITLYIVSYSAQKQVRNSSISVHNKVYTAYLQTIERERKQGVGQPQEDVITENIEELPGQKGILTSSPYWAALWDVRRQFPQYRINLILEGTVEGESERKSLGLLKNRPRGWRLTDQEEGWSRSFFILPTKNTAVFQVVSYIRDELNEWQIVAILLGVYSAIVLFLFGWFWTRAVDTALTQQTAPVTDAPSGQVLSQVTAMHGLVQDMGLVLHQLHATAAKLTAPTNAPESLELCLNQIQEKAIQALVLLKTQTTNGEVFEKKSAPSRHSVG